MSNFSFVSDRVLKNNLIVSFNHILDLATLSSSDQYKKPDKIVLAGSLRKTIVIHTASIIEALLLWKLKKEAGNNKIELVDEWKYYDINSLYKINSAAEVIGGKRRKEKKSLDKLDFLRITNLCVKYNIIKLRSLRHDIDKVRKLRNRLHLGGLSEVEKGYSEKELEFCFSVARRVVKIVSRE